MAVKSAFQGLNFCPLFRSWGKAQCVYDAGCLSFRSGASVIISRQLTRLSLAGISGLLGLSLVANARSQSEQASADIRRTSFGVPHLRADNERGLGYGIGYAYAQDNLCLLANEITTVNGERSRYFGPEPFTVEERENLVADSA
jgi:acyl-homoserine-lactone acylase